MPERRLIGIAIAVYPGLMAKEASEPVPSKSPASSVIIAVVTGIPLSMSILARRPET